MDRNIMVDIETYSTKPNAALIQIGACTFDEKDTFLVSIDPDYYGPYTYDSDPDFHIDPKTVAWWGTQSQEAQDSLSLHLVDTPKEALALFTAWIRSTGFRPNYSGRPTIWANPPQFDLVILRNAMDHCSMDYPWHYRQERCARTIGREFNTFAVGDESRDGLIAHRADHDAIAQARWVKSIYRGLRPSE